jgi:hypothetical protein
VICDVKTKSHKNKKRRTKTSFFCVITQKVERIRGTRQPRFVLSIFSGVANEDDGVDGVSPYPKKIEILFDQSYNSTHYTTETTWEFHLTVRYSNIYICEPFTFVNHLHLRTIYIC